MYSGPIDSGACLYQSRRDGIAVEVLAYFHKCVITTGKVKGLVNSFTCITCIGEDEPKLATVIGCGAFGKVYKAVWCDSIVAAKVIAVAANPKELDNGINTLTCNSTLNLVNFPGL